MLLCAFGTANAQLSSDEISEAILVEGSIPVKWTNDTEHPWIIGEDGNGNYMRTPESEAEPSLSSVLTFTYTSSYPTEISFEWYWRDVNSNYRDLSISVDGDNKGKYYSNGSWTSIIVESIPAGTHTVQFISNSNNTNYNYNYYSAIRNLRVWEYKELESSCLKEGSLPLTFKNDSENLWITEDGYIQSKNTTSTSKISTTFTIDTPSIFSFEVNNPRNEYTLSQCYVFIDGVFDRAFNSYYWDTNTYVLYPGTHTIEFENWIKDGYYDDKCKTLIRNVRLDQNWYEVTLNNPGELGTRLTQALEGKPIQDMELLKINGAMNSDDWSSIKLLTGIRAIDFTNTGITEIPENACNGFKYLSTVMLPETLKEIGDLAFKGTDFYEISIPASVEIIGYGAWSESNLRYITLPENSKLKHLGYQAFYKTRLIEFDMPDTVETLGTYNIYSNYDSRLFEGCTSLKKLHLSNKLKDIPGSIAHGCNSLTEVNLPDDITSIGVYAFKDTRIDSLSIPKNVTSIGRYAFEGCSQLKTVNLNSHCWDMPAIFTDCKAIETVVLPCATPPNTKEDPFERVDKSKIQLVVPDFAFDSFRSNSYWYQFTNTVKGDQASINDYWAIRGTLNLNNELVMQGNPSVEMMESGKMTLDSNSAQTFNEFTYNTSESSPAAVLSQSNSVKADRLVSKFYVDTKDKWFFFSPVTDVKMSDVSYPSTDSWVIRYYDGARRASENTTSGNWVNVPADGTLKGGQGYIIQARETGWLYLPAASAAENDKFFGANQVTFDLADNACETEANAGWNFVANPYPTYYDIYYIDMQAPITVWDGSTYRAYSLNDGDRGDDTFVLRPMQPFFVQKATADLSTGMPLVGRQINTTIDRSRAPRPVVVDENRHKLNLELYCNDNEEADDYTRIVLNEDASMAYETIRDASKFMSMDASVAQIYTLGDNDHPMAINERPYEDGNVALGVLLPATDRTYRLAALRADRTAWLYDAETGIEFDLTAGDYIFSASKAGIDNTRFSIRFLPVTTAVDGIDATAVKVSGNIGSISIEAPAGASVAVFGTDGSLIANTIAENGTLEISVAGGVYVVKVNGESFKTIVK